jgi:LysW-gamma-L-lysine carboxypeptidase
MIALSPEAFLEELVRIRSVSGEEKAASEFAVAQMKLLGFRESYVDQAGSAIGIWGKLGGSPRIILLGHIDTVPGEIPVRVEKGVLFGRGSVDAKGPLGTFIQATARLPKDVKAEIVVIGATEEEAATSKGARQALVDWAPPDFCVIGEPSGTNGVTLGYKGRLLMDLSVKRPGTHTAHAHQSVGEGAIAMHASIKELIEKSNAGREGIFDRLDCSLRKFNTTSDGIEDLAEMTYGFRLGPSDQLQDVESRLRAAVLGTKLEVGFSRDATFKGHESAIRRDRRNSLVSAYFAGIRAEGLEPKTLLKTGTADMNVVGTRWQCPICAFGPGDSALDHTPSEHLSLEEYEVAIRVLTSVLARITN